MSKKENKFEQWFEVKEKKISADVKHVQDEFDNVFGDMLKEFNIKSIKEERKTA